MYPVFDRQQSLFCCRHFGDDDSEWDDLNRAIWVGVPFVGYQLVPRTVYWRIRCVSVMTTTVGNNLQKLNHTDFIKRLFQIAVDGNAYTL